MENLRFLDSDGEPMSEGERDFFNQTFSACLSGHLSVPGSTPDPSVVRRALEWADCALEVYRGRIEKRKKNA